MTGSSGPGRTRLNLKEHGNTGSSWQAEVSAKPDVELNGSEKELRPVKLTG
jgi:hypothetical protein